MQEEISPFLRSFSMRFQREPLGTIFILGNSFESFCFLGTAFLGLFPKSDIWNGGCPRHPPFRSSRSNHLQGCSAAGWCSSSLAETMRWVVPVQVHAGWTLYGVPCELRDAAEAGAGKTLPDRLIIAPEWSLRPRFAEIGFPDC